MKMLYRFIFSSLVLLAIESPIFSQTVKGLVTSSDDGMPLIGVNVLVKGSAIGTITEVDGTYTVQLGSTRDTLVFSYTGFSAQEVPVNGQSVINLVMQPESKLLNEVVVIGYGTIKKSDLTGSVAKVSSEELIKVPTTNAVQALQGKVAGLQILSTSGDPGADPVVRLRGITTLNNNNPIAVIDGVITDIGAISLLNANDIQSIEVLKDASASAIYGSRGAAGVIIVTTKRGESGKNQVSFSVERGIESVADRIDVMNGREFATYINAVEPGTYNNFDALANTDWQDLIFTNNAAITNANFSVSGGSPKATYYFGLGYFGQEGVIPKSGLERLTGKINSNYNLTDRVSIGLDLSVQLRDKDNAPGVINSALWAWPIDVPYQADGVTFAEVNGGNPLAAIEYTNSNTKNLSGLGNLYASVGFLKYFTYKSSVQFDLTESKSKSFSPVYFVGPLQQNDINDLTYSTSNNNSVIFENTLTYNQEFGKHNVIALAGYTTQDIRNEFITGATEGLLREDELFWYLNAGQDELERVGNNFTRSTLISYLGRVNYSYDSRYLFTASFRRDGSSKFGPKNKYGNFPSLAVGWNVSNEPFFNKGLINRMKVRASWGIIGNEKIDGNAQYSLIVPGVNGVFGESETQVPGATFDGGGNPNLKWEETRQSNIGVDLGFWDDKLTAEVDYYVKKTNDILVPLEPIGYTGIGAFRSIFYNAANVKNSGLEWSLNYRDRAGKFNYKVGIIGTTIRNEVTDIGEGLGADSLLVGGDLGNGQQVARTAVGSPIGYFYGYEVIGVFQSAEEVANSPTLFGQGPGDLKYRDVNEDGKLDAKDRTIIGNSIPDLIYGFNLEVGYQNITLSADFQGQLGSDIYNGKQAIRFTTLNYEEKYNNFWDGEGSTNSDHRASLGGVNFLPSSYFVEDGSFLRLRTLTLNYSLPNTLMQKWRLSNANVYLRGTNLFTATPYTGYSPEIGASSAVDGVIDRGVYPVTRIFTLGLNANF
jgi:TonB-linked SusC/RagA family outer membrane protein